MIKKAELINKALKLFNFSDDFASRVAGDISGKVASQQVQKVFGLEDIASLQDDVNSSDVNRGVMAGIREALDPIFGETVEKNIPYSARSLANIKSNITIYSDTYYKARQLVNQGSLQLNEVADYARKENLKLITGAGKSWVWQFLDPKLAYLNQTTGISKATYDVINKWSKVAKNSIDKGDIRMHNHAMKQIKEQLHGQFKADYQSGKGGLIKNLEDVFLRESKLPTNVKNDIVNLQRLDKLPRTIRPVIATQKSGTYLQDMFHNDMLGTINYIIANAKKTGMSMTKLKNVINKEIEEITLSAMKRDKKFKSWSPEEIKQYYGRFGFQPRAELTPDGLKITNVIMSADYTAGYAPVMTYVSRDYKKVQRVINDVYDGGTIGKFDFKKGFGYNMSVAQNKGWNYKNKNILVEASDLVNVPHLDSTVLSLKYSPMWRKVKQRPQFKRTIEDIANRLNLPSDTVEDELLLRINRYVEIDTSSGRNGPLKSLNNFMQNFLPSHSSSKKLDFIVREVYNNPKLAVSVLGDEADSAVLRALREKKRANDLINKGKEIKPKKLPKDVETIVDLINEAESRGMNSTEAITWALRNGAKIGIGASALTGVAQLFDDDVDVNYTPKYEGSLVPAIEESIEPDEYES